MRGTRNSSRTVDSLHVDRLSNDNWVSASRCSGVWGAICFLRWNVDEEPFVLFDDGLRVVIDCSFYFHGIGMCRVRRLNNDHLELLRELGCLTMLVERTLALVEDAL
jgi:hypothetical protein